MNAYDIRGWLLRIFNRVGYWLYVIRYGKPLSLEEKERKEDSKIHPDKLGDAW